MDFKCSICGEIQEPDKIAIKWNQETKEGWCLCVSCRDHYRKENKTSKIQKDSYNYLTTTIRQSLVRHGLFLNERSIGGLRSNNFVKWSLKATSPNDYIIKIYLEIERKSSKEYIYHWEIKSYLPSGNLLKEAECDRPNVPMIKDFLNDFFKEIGSDPYAYFRSSFKAILEKHNFSLLDESEDDGTSIYSGMHPNNKFRWEAKIEKDFKWHIKAYSILAKGVLVDEHNGGSFSLTPLKEFFNRLVKRIN